MLGWGLDWIREELQDHKGKIVGTTLGVFLAAGAGWYYLQWRTKRDRILQRPYTIRDLQSTESIEDPMAEFTTVVTWLQDTLVRPIDARLPGQPFDHDLLAFPGTPMVLILGNHSAGKSTFINRLLGISSQETGVAPSDDGFTCLQRHANGNVMEDGPTLLSCPENAAFKELQRYGQPFWGHFRRKRLQLPKDTVMPFGLQIVDTPGMIDMPTKPNDGSGGRGYNFLEVIRWFAKRSDLILLLFDPDKPGTTGEALDALTKSLNGLDHKFLIVLNKVDQLDSSVDFARAYGTLGWGLSKVIPRKDIPQIYTMYNAGTSVGETVKEHKLPLEAFRKKRDEVVAEVLHSKSRHWDNVVTYTEDTLRQLEMVATVSSAVQQKCQNQAHDMQLWATVILGVPGLIAAQLFRQRWTGSNLVALGFWASYALICFGVSKFLEEYFRQFERLQIVDLDAYFERAYAWYFIHVDASDLRGRWAVVRTRVMNILQAAPSIRKLPAIASWEIARIDECLQKDIWYLRLLAKLLREIDSSQTGSTP